MLFVNKSPLHLLKKAIWLFLILIVSKGSSANEEASEGLEARVVLHSLSALIAHEASSAPRAGTPLPLANVPLGKAARVMRAPIPLSALRPPMTPSPSRVAPFTPLAAAMSPISPVRRDTPVPFSIEPAAPLPLNEESSSLNDGLRDLEAMVRKSIITTPLGIEVTHLVDVLKHSSSEIITATSGKESVNDLSQRRLLVLDAGGIRVIYAAGFLSILEYITKQPSKHIFDVFAGSSMSTTLAMGLASKRNHTALDLLKMLARHGYKFYDPKGGETEKVSNSQNLREGPDKLLAALFGNDMVKTSVEEGKTVHLFGYDPVNQVPVHYSNTASEDYLRETRVAEALEVAAATPGICLPQKITVSDMLVPGRDGGIALSCPAQYVYQKEKKEVRANYRLYSFGAGYEKFEPECPFGAGSFSDPNAVLENAFAAQIFPVVQGCKDEIASDSPLTYFARIQPCGRGKMDDTSTKHIEQMLARVYEVASGPAFAQMVTDLGFTMISLKELRNFWEDVYDYLFSSFATPIYLEMSFLEKEFARRSILEMAQSLDFRKFENWQVRVAFQSPKEEQSLVQRYGSRASSRKFYLRPEERTSILTEITQEAGKDKGAARWLWSCVVSSEDPNYSEMIQRGAEFYNLVRGTFPFSHDPKDKNEACVAEFYDLMSQAAVLLHETSPEPDHRDKPTSIFPSLPAVTHISKYNINDFSEGRLNDIYKEFIDFCESDKATYKYDSTGPYIDLVASIYWNKKLSVIEDTINVATLRRLHSSLLALAEKKLSMRSYSRLDQHLRDSRELRLAKALDVYIEKRFPQPVKEAAGTSSVLLSFMAKTKSG